MPPGLPVGAVTVAGDGVWLVTPFVDPRAGPACARSGLRPAGPPPGDTSGRRPGTSLVTMDGLAGIFRQSVLALVPLATGRRCRAGDRDSGLCRSCRRDHAGGSPSRVVVFWTIYRPDLLGYGPAFAIGLLGDLTAGLPLGMTALILVLARYATLAFRRRFVRRPFVAVWFGFSIIALGAGGAGTGLLASALAFRFQDMPRILVQFLLTAVSFSARLLDSESLPGAASPSPDAASRGRLSVVRRARDSAICSPAAHLFSGAASSSCSGGLVNRLHGLQVREADKYRILAEENRINVRLLAPLRGVVHGPLRRGSCRQPACLPAGDRARADRKRRRCARTHCLAHQAFRAGHPPGSSPRPGSGRASSPWKCAGICPGARWRRSRSTCRPYPAR